ncbi:MAG TPA: MFS transporter [Caulobacteraceae bacterium]|nr:MFS transporter [Caulobacteraceae bacterium]
MAASAEAAFEAPYSGGAPARHVAAVTIGNALDFYDFLTYAFFAPQIGRTFFPAATPSASLLAALATFGAGFMMRPVGAWLIGGIGDRVGRKPAMLLTFALMGAAMAGLALTPSYASIGLAAPLLAIAFRLLQGFALGGEVGPNTAFLVEAAPLHRRGLYVAFQYLSQDLSVLATGVVGFALASLMNDAALDAWGWRIAFGLGVAIVPFGLAMRRQLGETLDAPEPTPIAPPRPPPSRRTLAILGLTMLASGTVVSYVSSYIATYTTQTLRMSTQMGFVATMATGLVGVALDPVGGWLADRFGRKPVMVAPWVVLLLIGGPAFWWASQAKDAVSLIALAVALTVPASFSSTSTLVAITEALPRQVRSASLGLIYAFAISVFGGSTQFVVAWLTGLLHSDLAPAWYMTFWVAVGCLAKLMMPETSPVKAAPS